MPDASNSIVDVAVGVLTTTDGQVLLGSRPEGKPWSGWWEMPGGKLEAGETAQQALARELFEELGITVTVDRPWVTYVHVYPSTTVRLHFRRVTGWQGEPRGLENQALKWVRIASACQLPDLLPAAYPPLNWLQLPDRYLISSAINQDGLQPFLQRLDDALKQGVRLVQWREPLWQHEGNLDQLRQAFIEVRSLCHDHDAKLMINSCHGDALWPLADGVHFRSADAQTLSERPPSLEGKLIAASAHNPQELSHARLIGADFAVLGPVLTTASHPGEPTLGWESFERLNQDAGLPVFAIGGQTPDTLTEAQSRGAHGIAGIRQLLG